MLEVKNIIGGEHRVGNTSEVRERRNPANSQLVSTFVVSSKEDLGSAVDSARGAFDRANWSRDPKLRARTLRRICDAISTNFEHLARLQTSEVGKVIRDSRAELNVTLDLFEYYSGMTRAIYGRTYLVDPNVMSFVVREPVGVVGIIVPWNSPILLLARSLAPALAAGNSVVIKPSSHSPGTIYEFVRILCQSTPDLPKDVINLVFGEGEAVGRELVSHPDVDMISFTGSTEAGSQVMKDASVNLKRLSLELGGKTPNIILDDADFDSAILGAIRGSMLGSAGQQCFAGTRLIVQDSIYDKFRERMTKVVPTLKIGDAIDESIDVGPVISESQAQRVMRFVEEGMSGAKLLIGGKRLVEGEYSKGYFIEPTIFDEVPHNSAIAQEEIFGPVLSMIRFSDLEELTRIANGTKYGLSAAIWTSNINKAMSLARNIRAGVIWINTFGRNYSEVETGGAKRSGFGRLRGIEGLHTFTELKNVLINVSS